MKENLMIKGTFEFVVNGVTVSTGENLLTFTGLTILAELLANSTPAGLANIAAGSGTTAPTESDVSLEAEYSRKPLIAQKLTGPDANKVMYTATWGLGEIIGSVSESGIFTGTEMFNRSTSFVPVVLTATDLLVINWTIAFINV